MIAWIGRALREAAQQPEAEAVQRVLGAIPLDVASRGVIAARAAAWVQGARERVSERPLLESLLAEFGLSNPEGIALMCLAEALLRIPDADTADRLIAEKLAAGNWAAHAGESDSLFVNASTWGLMLTGRLVDVPAESRAHPGRWLTSLMQRSSEPLIRGALRRAMQIIGGEFVVGSNIENALKRSARDPALALCSFDMLGEGARTLADADRYFAAYEAALQAIGERRGKGGDIHGRSGLSIKLSALEPRYLQRQRDRVLARLLPRVERLCRIAAQQQIGLTIDAEEAERLELSLEVFDVLAQDPETRNWPGLGLAVQAYGRRALPLLECVAAIARQTGRRLSVRLVKGAYWDAEIKRAQEQGLAEYPVFTRKAHTDVSYLACAAALFRHAELLYPQFATHNAHTIAAILALRPPGAAMEFQRLHGMGMLLYDEARRQAPDFPPVRTYAPVGPHEDLLGYLVRRLLENGANTSFVNRFLDADVPVEQVVRDPLDVVDVDDDVVGAAVGTAGPQDRHVPGGVRIPLPAALFGAERANSCGIDWGDPEQIDRLVAFAASRATNSERPSRAHGAVEPGCVTTYNPADRRECVGEFRESPSEDVARAFDIAAQAQPEWDRRGGAARAALLVAAADRLVAHRGELVHLLVREAGKTLPDAIAEAREAEDYCRYYAAQATRQFSDPVVLPGPTGERNTLGLRGRGVFACISPWNFPLAIFLGQVSAALVAGNTVVAKPAEATPLIARLAVDLLRGAGVPHAVLQLTPAQGPAFGQIAFAHPELAGVAFTGSTATAQTINRALASRDGAILPLIAETGGLNAMLVDSSALIEQVVDDVIASAFTSAGQRCSGLRLLMVQEEIADALLERLAGAMQELVIGDPADPATDVGPLIDERARTTLQRHAEHMDGVARRVFACTLDARHAYGTYFAPRLYELRHPEQLTQETFGPILHVWRFGGMREGLSEALAAIRRSGYGLTLGVHSRLESVWQEVVAQSRVGNVYVNRNMIGAVVGVQPFGGEGLSGTGPKAGGPHYLPRFATERVLTINTVATGGDTELLALGE